MTILGFRAAAALCLASVMASAQSASAATTPSPLPAAVGALGMNFSASAAQGEKSAEPGAILTTVRLSVQNTIILAGAEPRVVVAALDSAITNCRARVALWVCPTSNEAFAALASLRDIVVAQVQVTDPAAFDTPGSPSFGEVPSITPGASYSVVR